MAKIRICSKKIKKGFDLSRPLPWKTSPDTFLAPNSKKGEERMGRQIVLAGKTNDAFAEKNLTVFFDNDLAKVRSLSGSICEVKAL